MIYKYVGSITECIPDFGFKEKNREFAQTELEKWKQIAYDYLAGLANALELETETLEVTLIDKFSLSENRERKITKNSLQLEIKQYEELGGLEFVESKS